MASSIPTVGDQNDDLENAVFREKQGIGSDVPSPTFSRLLCCLRSRCLRGICVGFPCVVFLLLFLSLPSSTATSTRRVFLILAAVPLIIYIVVGISTVVLAYCTQVSLETQNAQAAHQYLNTKTQQSKIAVTTGQKQQSNNFPGRFALFLEAARSGDAKTAQLCLRNEQIVDEVLSLLLRNGASIDQQDSLDGLTALHYAAFYGHIKSTRLLVCAGASMTIMDNRRMNPLQLTEMASLKLASVQPTHQMIIKYLRIAMKDDVTSPLEHVAGLTVLQLVERQAHNLPQME
ncbi:uncharacterized protein PITG_16247 [Phytophthora infestans T30-4]|uniref:Uncharacterized protein n=1 Tax=Phytophthora infestans (strain T30-4) TaxID=403677 RepID=D0NTG5_PHYIT|nr:uncharacterized protein PITG_16247 [Phytophthora infestans T30-4]EEY64916.1 conserved hypothetical protein [Phytophthora infestans T30-4]|eukprot:XP_002897646.1 conserved hypothetical protein [Phytophthora infestans T30-4]